MNRRSWLIGGALAAVAVASVGISILWSSAEPGHGEAALDADVLAAGRVLYQTHCASCHGVDLEGQPNWQTPLPNGRLPAPPHDATGHTWHHADGVLLRITREGSAAVVGAGYESDMLGFGGLLTDSEMRSILDFIKSTWPERERLYQAEMTKRERGQQ
ncbi:MAG TPA: cytochrome c [Aestuariivirgaceae bacterium]|nr:cytochrome c [Aestuariivirgaceae bacterium]